MIRSSILRLIQTLVVITTPTVSMAFWGKDYPEPPPIIRTEPPNAQEVQKLQFGRLSMNDQAARFGLAKHAPLIPDWSAAKSGKLLGSWNPVSHEGNHPTLVIQHGGVGGPVQLTTVMLVGSFQEATTFSSWTASGAEVSLLTGGKSMRQRANICGRFLPLAPTHVLAMHSQPPIG